MVLDLDVERRRLTRLCWSCLLLFVLFSLSLLFLFFCHPHLDGIDHSMRMCARLLVGDEYRGPESTVASFASGSCQLTVARKWENESSVLHTFEPRQDQRIVKIRAPNARLTSN